MLWYRNRPLKIASAGQIMGGKFFIKNCVKMKIQIIMKLPLNIGLAGQIINKEGQVVCGAKKVTSKVCC